MLKPFYQFKQMFSQMGVGYAVVELDHCHNVQHLIKSLVNYTGHYTVPQVFINGKFIGGEIDVFHMRASGELRTLLHKVFHGLAYNKCPIDVLQPCTPTVVGPRAGLPKAWSTPEAFTKYKPISYSMSTPVKQYPIYRKEDHILYPEYR
ncbi:uncharacterized protein LOC106674360 isoform X3 [Cimex lectularius]|uniref:Glutaredoxin domain-containing protein n=1 Tax=Cimex lectularius TaxID=79782 RepID=A0A8I6SDR3_CIMLE|nr:uncharacterized protein LOC106674360 isoform X3 [Cimex lectularius]